MINYRKLNNVGGWLVFAISTITYLLTIEPTTSWWDCGEYIATAYKLQVGHPPGAPLFQMLGRFFSLFAFGNVENVALMMNVMAALCSSFTILFLFWSITMLAKKIALRNGEMNQTKIYTILGSGLVGALAYTFSDSFWFSAVEGEVYAMSSFFTALVFWAILKWEESADDKYSLKWIILIAYLIGLSIGVHLLNLLAIPAIAYVYYYKKHTPSRKGFIYTGIVSLLLLVTVMYIIIPGVVRFSSLFELFFVNNIGLPFNTGTIIYFLLIIGLLVWGVKYSIKKKKLLLNTVILCFIFILIGYSSFFMLIIRSNANVPIDQNSPEEAISMLSYLNREQYGNWPLLSGQYYNAPWEDQIETSNVYFKDKKKGKYTVVRKNFEYVYDKRFTTFFPRMWSDRDPKHINMYKKYTTGIPIRVTDREGNSKVLLKPTFGDNLRFFWDYQVNHMYFRYFMWNFAGRQNDIESQGDPRYGNWISGINFIDDFRLGNMSNLPESLKNNATNKFYMLPLLLGLIGVFFHVRKSKADSWVVFLLFFMTGLAIVIYLNQFPYQPRERDYAYAGSFYAFAIWIGLGVFAIVDFISRYLGEKKIVPVITTGLCLLLVPVIMASEGWDDHDRSGKYAARDFARNYLEPLPKNSVIYTIGDNDTFPLWYAQEVEGIRTDVRVVNYMLSSGEWYILQLGKHVYDAEPLPFSIPPEKYDKGQNDIVAYYPQRLRGGDEHVDLKLFIDFIASDHPDTQIRVSQDKAYNTYPTKKVKLKVDSAACVDNGIVPKELAHLIVDEIEWTIKTNEIRKNDLAFLDFLANNNWERNIYLTNPGGDIRSVFTLDEYIYLEGNVFRFMPIKAHEDEVYPGLGAVNVERSYEVFMNETAWGNLNDPDVNIDRETTRNVTMVKQNIMRTAQALASKKQFEKAEKLIDKCFEKLPTDKFNVDRFTTPFVQVYYMAGAFEKAEKLSKIVVDRYVDDIKYYMTFDSRYQGMFNDEIVEAVDTIRGLSGLASGFKREEHLKVLEKEMENIMKYFE